MCVFSFQVLLICHELLCQGVSIRQKNIFSVSQACPVFLGINLNSEQVSAENSRTSIQKDANLFEC